MAATALLKKSPIMKESMIQVDPPKEAIMVKKNEWPVATPILK